MELVKEEKSHVNKRILGLEKIRALSCILVIISHTYFANGLGGVGVNYFFVISGFALMASTQYGNVGNEFWSKRLVKILPLYYLMTLFTSISIILFPALFNSYEFSIEYLIKTLLFIPYEHSGIVQPIMGLGWTLNIEMFCYLLFFLCMKMSYRYRGCIFGGISFVLMAIGLILCVNKVDVFTPLSVWLSGYVFEFTYGVIAYSVSRKLRNNLDFPNRRNRKNTLLANTLFYGIFISSMFIMTFMRATLEERGYSVVEGTLCGVICGGVALYSIIFSDLIEIHGFIVYIASVSYELYLMHIYPIRIIEFIEKSIMGMDNNYLFFSVFNAGVAIISCIPLVFLYRYLLRVFTTRVAEYSGSVVKTKYVNFL